MRASEFQWPKIVSSDWLVNHIADMHGRDDPYEGDVPERILQHGKWSLVQVPLDSTDAKEYQVSPDLVADYAYKGLVTMPPIVFDQSTGEIIDGFHRANAALHQGANKILAYVPLFEVKLAEDATTRTLYHTSRKKNRSSILKHGLEARTQEYTDISRNPGIYMFESLPQTLEWAFWSAMHFGVPFDIWEVTVPRTYKLIRDKHEDMDIYNAVIGYEPIPPEQLRVLKTQAPVRSSKNAPERAPLIPSDINESSKPIIDAHRVGDTIWIDYFEVPVRRQGQGTKEYQNWEQSLPTDIKKIRLFASDAGHGSSHEFWDSMGFDYEFPDDDNQMIKYINQNVTESKTPHNNDIKDVADWLDTTPENLTIKIVNEPIEKFLQQIKEMYDSYDEFPEDARRTNKIIKALKAGSKPYPIFVEADDPHLFVMEGRHRMVAFWQLGIKTIPVAYVSKKTSNLTESEQTFYHGSMDRLPVGTVLTPRDNYEDNWSSTDFYAALEKYRPKNMLAHKQSVFMCDSPDDVDLAGGGTEWLFTVVSQGPIQRHDLNWGSEISMLISDGHSIDSPEVRHAAENYWAGTPHYNESVWEYLTPSAKIIDVEPY